MSDKSLKVTMVSISDIHPNPDNPRHNSSAVPAVAESIRLFGFKVPLVVDSDNMILAGHTRYRAALSLGLKSIPCVVAADLTEEEQAAFSVAENRTSDFATFDLPRLAEIVEDIPEDLIAAFDIDSLLADVENADDETISSEKKPEKRDGLDLAPFEKYQYVMILCRTDFDYSNLLAFLDLEDIQKAYVSGNLKRGASYGRVIEYADFQDKVGHREN